MLTKKYKWQCLEFCYHIHEELVPQYGLEAFPHEDTMLKAGPIRRIELLSSIGPTKSRKHVAGLVIDIGRVRGMCDGEEFGYVYAEDRRYHPRSADLIPRRTIIAMLLEARCVFTVV